MTGPARYKRNHAVSETELNGEIFLVEPETEELFYLDAMSAGLWRLIAAPQSLGETVEVYHAAFPDADRQAAEIDVVFIKGLATPIRFIPIPLSGYRAIWIFLCGPPILTAWLIFSSHRVFAAARPKTIPGV